MKKIRLTPILLLFPILIIVFIFNMVYYSKWTPFSLPAIFIFIFIMCIVLFIDRILIIWLKSKIIWFSEIAVIVILLVYFVSKCT